MNQSENYQSKDWATGKPIDLRKPEERVRQEYEMVLHRDYDYSKEQMDIEVYIQRGNSNSRKNRIERADLVIYKSTSPNERDQHLHILGIAEFKSPSKNTGIGQLKSYMSATSAIWGVWTNGNEIAYLYRDPQTGIVSDNALHQIPKQGESIERIGTLTKDDLQPPSNLRLIFNRLLKTLYSNTNISRREKLGNEMIRLLFCKIWDEKYYPESAPKFRVEFNEQPNKVKKRIVELFEEVKKELAGDGVFEEGEKIGLDDESVAYVVGELQPFSLLKTDKDVVGDAFEVFAESKLVGEKGEFFTPREVVKTAVQIVNPKPEEDILDPACGSGGFLIYTLEHIWRQMENSKKYRNSPDFEIIKRQVAERHIFGIDKEIDLVKISKAYMAIIGDGRGRIVQQNSLHNASEFKGRARDLFVNEDGEFKLFDVILTNPPFGAKIKVIDSESKHFDLGHTWKKQGNAYLKTSKYKKTEPQILFVERCLQMLKSGGRLAIILPETYLHAPKCRYVLDYIKNGNNIIAIIDLPHNTFRPYNNAKTALIILEKDRPQTCKIKMGVAEEMGHDHLGRQLFRYDPNTCKYTSQIWDDMIEIRKELRFDYNGSRDYTFEISPDEIKDNIYVPRYYWMRNMEQLKSEAERRGYMLVSMAQLCESGVIKNFPGHGSPEAKYKGKGEVAYVRVADIVNWSVYKNPTSLVPNHVYEATKGRGVDLREKDVLFVRRGSYRIGNVALVSPLDTKVLLTREIHVFRVTDTNNEFGINPYYLLYLLSHELTQLQLPNKILVDTTLPNIGDRWRELLLPVAVDADERAKISTKLQVAFEMMWKGQEDIHHLSQELGHLTL
ncbi:MAG: N-6 DNA methylase [bacterium]|jgi:type I restriction enzyme M protein